MTPSRIGLLVSLTLHALLAGALYWWWFAPEILPPKGRVVPLTLSMFDVPAAPVRPTRVLPEKKLAAVDTPADPGGRPAPAPSPSHKPEPDHPNKAPASADTPPVKSAPQSQSQSKPKSTRPKAKPPTKAEPKPAPTHAVEKKAKSAAKPKPKSPPRHQVPPAPRGVAKAHKPADTPPSAEGQSTSRHKAPAAASTGTPDKTTPTVDLTQLQLQYQSALSAAINRQKFYPRMARRLRQQGVVTVAFTVQADGRIKDIHVVESSGRSLLDKGAVAAIRRVGRFHPFPPALKLERMPLRISLNYNLR